jgi:hypothetical protein
VCRPCTIADGEPRIARRVRDQGADRSLRVRLDEMTGRRWGRVGVQTPPRGIVRTK